MAGAYRASEWRWSGHLVDLSQDRKVQNLCVALAGAVHARRRRRTASRQVASARQGSDPARSCRRDRPPHSNRRRIEATHWTLRAMAKTDSRVDGPGHLEGASASARIAGRASRSTDPAFVDKLTDIVALYVAPPAHAVVLSVDEKSQIGARPHPARAAAEERAAVRPRLQKERHDDAVCRAHSLPRANHPLPQPLPAGSPSTSSSTITRRSNMRKSKHGARLPRWTFHFTPISHG